MGSKPRTTFFTFIFVQGWLAPVVDLIPKGSPWTSSASRVWEGLFIQAGNGSQKFHPPLGVVALGGLSIPSDWGLWLAKLPYYFHKNTVCIWVERTCGQVRTCPFSRWGFLIHKQSALGVDEIWNMAIYRKLFWVFRFHLERNVIQEETASLHHCHLYLHLKNRNHKILKLEET